MSNKTWISSLYTKVNIRVKASFCTLLNQCTLILIYYNSFKNCILVRFYFPEIFENSFLSTKLFLSSIVILVNKSSLFETFFELFISMSEDRYITLCLNTHLNICTGSHIEKQNYFWLCFFNSFYMLEFLWQENLEYPFYVRLCEKYNIVREKTT